MSEKIINPAPGKNTLFKKDWLSLIILFSLAVNLTGFKWGLPSNNLNRLYFSDSDAVQRRIDAIQKYPAEEIYKGMGFYLVTHPAEAQKKLPRSWYNPIRSYHPDEYYVIKSISTMRSGNLDLNPHQYTVGGAYLYLIAALIFLFFKIGIVSLNPGIGYYFFHPAEMAELYLIGRLITALYGTGIVVLVFLITKKIWRNERTACLAGLLTIFSPLILLNAHFMYVDIPGVFWITAIFYLIVRISEKGRSTNKDYFYLGLLSGLAAGNKLTFIVSCFIPVFLILQEKSAGEKACFSKITKLYYAVAAFFIAFSVTNPYFFIAFPEPLIEMRQHTSTFVFNGLFYFNSLRLGLGWPLLAFILVGTISSFFLKHYLKQEYPAFVIIVIWIVFFFLFISSFSQNFARYILPIVPPMIVLGAGFWTLPSRIKFVNVTKRAFLIFTVITTFFYGMAYLGLFCKEPTRTSAGKWIKENLPAGATLGVTEVPWQFQMAPLDEERFRLTVTGYDIKNAEKLQPDYFILSSFQAEIPPVPAQMPPERSRFWKEFQTAQIYQPFVSFRQPLSFPGIRFRQDGAPEDIIYLNPTLVLFKKTGSAHPKNTGPLADLTVREPLP